MLKLIFASGRYAVWALVLFVAVILLMAGLNDLPGKIDEARKEADKSRAVAASLVQVADGFENYAKSEVAKADADIERFRIATETELKKAEQELISKRAVAERSVLGNTGIAAAAVGGNTNAILASYRAKLVDIPLIDRALNLVKLRQRNMQTRVRRDDLNRKRDALNRHITEYNQGVSRQKALKREAESELRNALCVRAPLPGVCSKVEAWRRQSYQLAMQKAQLDRDRARYRVALKTAQAASIASETVADGAKIAQQAIDRLGDEKSKALEASEKYIINTVTAWLAKYGVHAAWIVVAILVTPIVHKMIAFGVIAPLARQARPIQLPSGSARIRSSASQTSIDMPLCPDHELFVRNSVQSASVNIIGHSKVLLSWGMPFTCLAAGLVGLQRLRTVAPDRVTVTAVDDQLYEVALIEVPEGGSVVLQPRALVGIAKRRSDAMAIKRFWRFGQLVSWVTFQFRFVVFYGPCTLIVQGHRGVLAEAAGNDARMINKRLTVGFDTGLSYGAARSTSFLPYLRGQQSLFNDSFHGEGIYIYEQRSAGAGKGTVWGRGLKGLGDAVLSAFGV